MDERALAQLAVLPQVGMILPARCVRYWLRGGRAIDFPIGTIIRPHADLDLVLWARQRPRAQQALLAAGFQVVRATASQVDIRYQDQDHGPVLRRQDISGMAR